MGFRLENGKIVREGGHSSLVVINASASFSGCSKYLAVLSLTSLAY